MKTNDKLKIFLQWLALAVCCGLTLFFPQIFGARRYYTAALIFSRITIFMLFISFEKRGQSALRLSVTAVMIALAVSGRMMFAALPSFKPVAAVVIISGACLGRRPGFCVGALSMLISNFMFSQGPWTIWQMMSYGLIGFVSGLIFYKREKLKKPMYMAVFGLVFYIAVAGPVLDLSGVFAWIGSNPPALIPTLIAGLPVNISGGVSTFIFLSALAGPVMRKLDRLSVKYGL